ncbi:MAG TPA: MFS transporter [Marinilabiliaceae bacterium]|nr:MFS transporter [Marinilabiliaceae bacterium]
MHFLTPSISGNIPRLYIIKVAKWFMLTMPILMLFYKDMGFTNEEAFRLKAIYSIAIVIFEIPSGYLADVLGRRTTLIMGAILGSLGFFFYSIGTGYGYFILAEVTLGIGQSFISGADSALLYDSLKVSNREHKYTKFESINISVGNFAESLGAIAGGALAEISLRTPFIWQTGVAFIAIPAAFTLVEPARNFSLHKPGFKHILKIVHYSLFINKELRWGLIYSSLIGTATLTMAWVYQLQLNAFGFSEFHIGATATFLNLLVGVVTLWAYRVERNLSPRILMFIITFLIAGGFIAAGLSRTPIMLLVVLAIFYAVRGIATPVLKNVVNVMAPSNIRATVLSIRSLIIRAIFAVIAPLFGWMADLLSLNQALIIIGIVFMILCASFITLFIQSLDDSTKDQ